MTATTTYYARAPGAPRSRAVPVDSPRDAEALSAQGWYVTAVTRGGAAEAIEGQIEAVME